MRGIPTFHGWQKRASGIYYTSLGNNVAIVSRGHLLSESWTWKVVTSGGGLRRKGDAATMKVAMKMAMDALSREFSSEAYEPRSLSHRANPSSYAGDPYWTRARFKGECCKCHGVVRKGDPIYYYPKGKRVYCDGASCGKAANQDFISMRDDEDMYNRRNPSRRNPDYDALNKEHRRLRTMLTRAKNSGDPKKVIAACRAAVKAWAGWPAWPDDWHRWENALGDAQPWGPGRLELSDLESRSNPKRRNPSLGMPGMPHTWVTAKGVHVRGGDTVEFWDIAGHPRSHNPKKVRAKVNKMLVFDDHVQVSKGWAGTRVDDRNFIRVVRRA